MRKIKQKLIDFLAVISRKIIEKHKPVIVAIGGNAGKTTTKEAIYSVLSQKYHTRKTHKSFNSEIGVPLTIIGIKKSPWKNPFAWMAVFAKAFWVLWFQKKYPEILVLETGVDRPKDMDFILKIFTPEIAVITGLPEISVHMENFDSMEQFVEEEMKLAQVAKHIILDVEDKLSAEFAQKHNLKNVIFYGESSNINLTDYTPVYKKDLLKGSCFKIQSSKCPDLQFEVDGVIGAHIAKAFLSAAAVSEFFSLDCRQLAKGFEQIELQPGRARVFEGVNSSTIVDDSYNASYISVVSIIDEISKLKANKKIAILGDMKELGINNDKAHENVARQALETFDLVLFRGENANIFLSMAEKLSKTNSLFVFNTNQEIIDYVKPNVSASDIVLVKASQALRFEQIVVQLLKNKQDIASVPRQELAWKLR